MAGWTGADLKKMRQMGAWNPYGTLGPSPATAQKIAPWTPPKITPAVGQSFMPQFGGGFSEPNWGALIAGDPEFMGAEADINRSNLSDRASLRDAIRRAVVQSGFQVGLDEDVDPATQAAAAANQFSTRADIENQLRRGAATSDAELASRGLLDSGQFTENRSVLQRGADQATSQGMGALLDTIASGRQGYTSAVNERANMLRQLRASVAARLAQNPGIFGGGYGGGSPSYGDPFAPLANASAQQMWNAINNPSVRQQNAGIIGQGYDAFLRNYGNMFGGGGGGGGGGGAAPAPTAATGPWGGLYAKYPNFSASGNDADGRPYVIVNGAKRYS